MPAFSEFFFDSSTGKNSVHVKKCVPDGAPRGVIQIEHGIAEHIDRYGDFMQFLSENGFVVVGDDHLGHGKTIKTFDEKGFFAEKDGWSYVVKDIVKLHDITAQEYPGIPYIMFGHSMGSFLTRTFIIENPDKYDLVILSGTGQQSPMLINAGCLLSNLLVKMNGPKSDGQKLNDIAFGSYLDKIENPRTKFDWLSRDSQSVDKYIADSNCGFICTASLYRDMMEGIRFVTSRKNAAKMAKDKPVYFMSGADDPVGDYGKGVEKAYKMFCDAGLHDVMIRLYPGGRHEMLNEINKEDVYKDILNWINDKLS